MTNNVVATLCVGDTSCFIAYVHSRLLQSFEAASLATESGFACCFHRYRHTAILHGKSIHWHLDLQLCGGEPIFHHDDLHKVVTPVLKMAVRIERVELSLWRNLVKNRCIIQIFYHEPGCVIIKIDTIIRNREISDVRHRFVITLNLCWNNVSYGSDCDSIERSGSRSCSLGDNIWLRTIFGGPAASFNFPSLNQVPG